MKRSRCLTLLCVVALAGFVTGCSDSDEVVSPGPAPLTPQVVAAGLNATLPATIAFPNGIIEILTALAPPPPAIQGGPSCNPLPLNLCSTGTAEYCLTADANTDDWVFANCVTDDGTAINGTISVNTVAPVATLVFPSSGFTIDGNPVTGQMSIDALTAVRFVSLGISVEGNNATINGGPLNITGGTVNGVIQLLIQDSVFVPFQAAVTVTNNSLLVIVSDDSTTPPTAYTCTGSLTYDNGDFTSDLVCVEGTPG